MKTLVYLFFLSFLISCGNKKYSETIADSDNPNFKTIYPFALRGEMNTVFDILDTLNVKQLNKKEIQIKRRYYERFINQTEKYDYKTKDAVIIPIVDMFHSYWNDVMINNEQLNIADSILIESMSQYLFSSKYKSENISLDTIRNDIHKFSNSFLKEKGYFSNAFGKTGHLYDLFLWKNENVKNYSVELIDETINVTVHLMEDFISTGWSHYTTFGRSYASGWANRKALYCVTSAYDTESENYKISYLTHEGQHFSDYKSYPNLLQKDLEYRAKLVELAKSGTTTKQMIKKFITNASNQPENAHAFANYCVIRDLSKLVLDKRYTTKKNDWISVDSHVIKERSKELFRINTSKLDSIGSNIVIDFIK